MTPSACRPMPMSLRRIERAKDLDRVVRGADALQIAADDPAMAPTIACWALVLGFARFVLDGAIRRRNDADSYVATQLLPLMIDLLAVGD